MTTLITGASGFLGSYIKNSFITKKLDFITLGRSNSNNVICDLGNEVPKITGSIHTLIHAAGKAHAVPKTEKEKSEFYQSIVVGTKNILQAFEEHKELKKVVFISSVSVYGLTSGIEIEETHPLNAIDIYGKSKIEAENLIINWCENKNIDYYILRIPLIVGQNPPGNLGAMIKGIKNGKYARIGSASAKKSMILADNLAGFLTEINGLSGIYNLNDAYHPSFRELEDLIMRQFNKKKFPTLPYIFIKVLAFFGDFLVFLPINSNKLNKITSTLTFSSKHAIKNLNFKPIHILNTIKFN